MTKSTEVQGNTPSDIELLKTHGVDGLADLHLYAVLDRLILAGVIRGENDTDN